MSKTEEFLRQLNGASQGVPNDEDLRGLRDRALRNLGRLEAALSVLPRVDEDGRSECPFAEQLFAAKDEAMEGAERLVEALRDYVERQDSTIAYHRKRLAEVQRGEAHLHDEDAKKEYSFAVQSENGAMQVARDRRDIASAISSFARQMVAEAGGKKWPLGKPQKFAMLGSRPLAPSAAGEPSPGPQSIRGQLPGTELPGLIGLGPLTGSGSGRPIYRGGPL